MSRGMTFRKDCADCGRSFFTPDRKQNLCPRCVGREQIRDQQKFISKEKQSMSLTASKASVEAQSRPAVANDLKLSAPKEHEINEESSQLPKGEVQGDTRETKTGEMPEVETLDVARRETLLTKDQEEKIIERYQRYVEEMERPPEGRRRRIASEATLPYRAVVLAVRRWNQNHSQGNDLSREDRFRVEKSYFHLLETEKSFLRVKEQIARETGFSQWQVSRCLDLLHDGEDRLHKVPNVGPEQRTAILDEYHAYLSAPAPPEPPLHDLIAEKTGVDRKQVHKVLLAYRLQRFREGFSNPKG